MEKPDLDHIPFDHRSLCSVCGKTLGDAIINLPNFPLTELFTKTKPQKPQGFSDQYFHICRYCGHGQLQRMLDPGFLYSSSNYALRTSQSRTAMAANDVFAQFIKKVIRGRHFGSVIEIGCNDLYLLKSISGYSESLIGIDPVLGGKEKELSAGKIRVIGDFFENAKLDGLIRDSLVVSSHTLEHMSEPGKLVGQLLSDASEQSMFIFTFPGFDVLVSDGRYDQIFHQHLQYFSLDSFSRLIAQSGGEVIAHEVNYLHWGSLMVAFRKSSKKWAYNRRSDPANLIKGVKKDYELFRKNMGRTNAYLLSLKKEKLVGFGASLMLPILGYHLGNDFSNFECIADDDRNKKGLYYINLPVRIGMINEIANPGEVNAVITAVNTNRSILPRVLSLKPRRIIMPIPVI